MTHRRSAEALGAAIRGRSPAAGRSSSPRSRWGAPRRCWCCSSASGPPARSPTVPIVVDSPMATSVTGAVHPHASATITSTCGLPRGVRRRALHPRRGGIAGDRPPRRAVHRDLRQRNGDRRPRRPPPQALRPATREHDPAGRGSRPGGPAARRSRPVPRRSRSTASSSPCAPRWPELDSLSAHADQRELIAVARRRPAPAPDLPRARRTRRARRAARGDPRAARVGPRRSPTTATRRTCDRLQNPCRRAHVRSPRHARSSTKLRTLRAGTRLAECWPCNSRPRWYATS
jgi:hypothetical protein